MSAQTGSIAPPGPASSRAVDRARFRLERLRSEPNPIWIRELRQAARLTRTPVILTVVTMLMTFLIASIGGLASVTKSPAQTGVILFQVFFSLAYFVVTLVGPAVAANSIASEREGRTWEAVLLTGLPPGTIARGKFLAALTAIGMYIVMLAPVGALPFLFGGVTATETIVAFLFLALIAVLSVAFGLAVSSKMASQRAAIVLTLLTVFVLSSSAYGAFGPGLSIAAHNAWPGVPEGLPIWLPTAYARAPFGVDYVVFLILIPIAAISLPAWFLYEVTIANLTSPSDDQSTGLKRWFLVAAPIVTAAAIIPIFTVAAHDRDGASALGITSLFFFFTFCVFLFVGDPIGPSRRVTAHWDRIGASRLRRFLGPGITRAAVLLFLLGGAGLALTTILGVAAIAADPGRTRNAMEISIFGAYGTAFYLFTVGLGAFLRARAPGPFGARILLFATLCVISIGPWIIAAIGGVLASGGGLDRDALLIAAPSPFFVFVMFDALKRSNGDLFLVVGVTMMLIWVGLGFVFAGAAARRCARIIAQHEEALGETQRILAEEDAAAAPDATEAPPVESEPVAPATS